MGNVLSLHGFLWLPSFSYRSKQHLIGDSCSLSLADAGIMSCMFAIYDLSSVTLRLDWKQLNNHNDKNRQRRKLVL